MRHTILATLALFLCASASSQVIWDRTNEPKPLVVTQDTDWSGIVLVDFSDRPAIFEMGADLKIGGIVRAKGSVHNKPTDQGLGTWFDGVFLPKFTYGVSHHDIGRGAVNAFGTCHIKIGSASCDTVVNIMANLDGSYGTGSTVDIGTMDGYWFGVLATGQDGLVVNIGSCNAALRNADPNEGPGHAYYSNQATVFATGENLGCRNLTVTIGKSRGTPVVPNARWDSETVKFKGVTNVSYTCLDDENPMGAFDQYGSSGNVRVKWTHPGSDAANNVFTAFRCGGDGGFPHPSGKFTVSGTFDGLKCPIKVPAYRWETSRASFSVANIFGGAAPYVYPNTDTTGSAYSATAIN